MKQLVDFMLNLLRGRWPWRARERRMARGQRQIAAAIEDMSRWERSWMNDQLTEEQIEEQIRTSVAPVLARAREQNEQAYAAIIGAQRALLDYDHSNRLHNLRTNTIGAHELHMHPKALDWLMGEEYAEANVSDGVPRTTHLFGIPVGVSSLLPENEIWIFDEHANRQKVTLPLHFGPDA